MLSQPDRPAGRRRQPTPPPVAVAARELGLPLLQPERAGEAAAAVEEAGLAAMAICAYGQLVRPPLLDALPWLNLHPSLLPRWRGAAPVERALMAGDAETGVAIMELVPALDAGPIAALERWDVGPDDDAGDVMARALELGVPLLARALAEAAAGRLATTPQPEQGITYADKLTRADRRLDPAEPARAAHDRVRALAPHIGAQLRLGGQDVVVWRTEPSPSRAHGGRGGGGRPAHRGGLRRRRPRDHGAAGAGQAPHGRRDVPARLARRARARDAPRSVAVARS